MALIEDYALIGDLHTAALVGKDGSIDWMCLPRFDSPACFAALLDTPEAGRWLLAPADARGGCTRRRYLPGTLVLETEWEDDGGAVRVTDLMPVRDDAVDVVRIVECLSGRVEMYSELRIRFDYGRVVPWVRRDDEGMRAVAGPDAAYVTADVPLHGRDLATVSEFALEAGEKAHFVMRWAPGHENPPKRIDAGHALARTVRYWERWSARCRSEGPYKEAVDRSLITLKALTYAPTGGIVAAPTTSLPEQIGGPRNWDYRFCWLRDASLTLQSLLAAGYTDEAAAWRQWLLRAVAGDPGRLQIMYGLDGTRRLPELELDWLGGYEDSQPVRTGNAAAEQLQLDVWGEVLDALALARAAAPAGSEDTSWDIQVALMENLEKRWREQDNGLWEMRGPRRHFTHSKIMAWVAADRMAKAVRESGLPGPVERWEALRDEIHAEVMERGFDPERNTFTQSYGGTELDAALLLIPRVGFLPHDHPRVAGTVDAILRELTVDGFVLRYRPQHSDDGLPGDEGVFLACSFWMVDALLGLGRREEAEELFGRLLGLRNDVGLLAEEYEPRDSRQVGNFPQAFSHFPLVHCALQLAEGRSRASNEPLPGAGGGDAEGAQLPERAVRGESPGPDPDGEPSQGGGEGQPGAGSRG